MACAEKETHGDQASLSCQKDGRLNKNLDLIQDKEKLTVEETSASSVAQIVPNEDHTSNDIAEKSSNSAGGKIRATMSILTGPV